MKKTLALFNFLSVILYGFFQLYSAFTSSEESTYIEKTGWWFSLANLGNASWVVAFTYDQIALSVGIMTIFGMDSYLLIRRLD